MRMISKCRSMQVAIGYGMPRGRILFAKLLESAVLLLATAAVMAALLTAAPLLLGLAPTPQQMASLVLTAGAELLRALGYGAISAVAVFLTQNATGGTVLYVLLSSKTVYIIATMLLGQDFLHDTVGDPDKVSLYFDALHLQGGAGAGQAALYLPEFRFAGLYCAANGDFRCRLPQKRT